MLTADPGSFRDPASHVVYDGETVVRLLDERGLSSWRALRATPFFRRAVAEGRLIGAVELPTAPDGSAGALEHPRVATITYPYEWTFTMLQDAAVLQLGLLEEALGDGITIKDATPFNIQFSAGKPLFIDIGSFEPYSPGEPWIGYRQFTRQFLFPLLMRAWADLPFQPWLRGDMDGPTAAQMRRLLPGGKRIKPAAMMHVSLQARLEERNSGEAVRSELKAAGFSSDLILANVRRLRDLVESLEWEAGGDGWSGYQSCTHVGRDRDMKTSFLRSVLERGRPSLVVDLGANDGHFSRVAADSGAHVIAVDSDEPVLDRLYRSSRGSDLAIALSDLSNPSPAQGWAGTERPALFDRVRPEMVIAYGLIHHLIYTASIPPAAVIDWLRSFDCPIALEFVSPDDEMVGVLTANKLESELHPGRSEGEFRALMARVFEVASEQSLGDGTRILFELRPIPLSD